MKPNRLDALILAALMVLTGAVYAQVRDFDFVNYDDPIYVSDNALVRKGLTWEGLRWAFTTSAANFWHPLTWLSHMLDVSLFGLTPGFHHLVGLLLHLLNTALLFLVLKTSTGACRRSAFVAALFALHPLHVESVAWIAERKDVLSTFFWFLTTGAYVLYARKPGIQRYLAVVLLLSLGLMAKPMLVSLPIVFLLMDYWPLNRLPMRPAPADPLKDRVQSTRRDRIEKTKKKKTEPLPKRAKKTAGETVSYLFAEKIPLFIIAGVFSFVAFYTQQKGGALSSLEAYPLGVRLANAVVSFARYLFKMLWPSDLTVFYPFVRGIPSWQILLSAFLLFAVSIAVIRFSRRLPYLAFGWGWYLVTLLPVIGIVKVGDFAMADRYTYVPLIGPFVALSWGACDLAARFRLPAAVMPAAAFGVLAACAIVTHGQLAHWRDSHSLWTRALAVTERNAYAHNNLAAALVDDGRNEEALSHIERALAIQPRFAGAHFNRGVALARLGRGDEALPPFLKALEINPAFPDANYTVAGIYLSKGDLDRAIEHFERAIRTPEPQPKAYAGLAEAYTLKGRMDEALSYSLSALEWQPADAKLHYNIGSIYIHKGRVDEAISHFREAVRLAPDYSRAHNNLGSALMLRNRTDKAIDHFREAVRLDPDYGMARENLRDALAQQKRRR